MLVRLIGAAAVALVKAARNPVVRKAGLKAAQKAKEKVVSVSRHAVQACKNWPKNRAVRQAYNANKLKLKKEIDVMRKTGQSTNKIAEKAHESRSLERLAARAKMRKNGDGKSADLLEIRDLKKYGNKDGPTFAQSQTRAREKLTKALGRKPTEEEISESIIEGSLQTDWKTNLLYLSF